MSAQSTTSPLAFDERSFTVNLALALWTGLAAGGIAAIGGFDAAGMWDNGYARLATLALTSLLLGMAFQTTDSGAARRLQLAVMLSLIAHTLLLVGLAFANLRLLHHPAVAETPAAEQEEELVPPEIVSIEREEYDERADFERPLESGTPRMKTDAVTLERDAPRTVDTMILPTEVPRPQEPAPDAIELNRPKASIARADIQSGRRSRNIAASASLAPAPDEFDVGILFAMEEVPQQQPQPQPARTSPRAPRPLFTAVPPVVVAPQAETAIPLNRLPQATTAPRVAQGPAARPSVAPMTQTPRRSRVLAEISPTPSEFFTPPVKAASLPATEVEMVELAPTPLASARTAPPIRQPQPVAPVVPLPTTSEVAPVARPQRLAMLNVGPAPMITPDARPRGRSAPLASLGIAGRALEAPAAMLRSGSGQPGRPTEIDAAADRGGLGVKPSEAAGMARSPANRDAAANLSPGRFRGHAAGGSPSTSSDARHPSAAFSSRGDRVEQMRSGSAGSPSAQTEAAIELGLKYLSSIQQSDGGWAFNEIGSHDVEQAETPQIRADGAATGLTLLAFLGAGYDHIDGPYQSTVQRGLDSLVERQASSGLIFPEEGAPDTWQVARFYSHGIASIALCEAYGMTGDPRLREPAQRALDYIVRTQVASRGGWRYTPGYNADLSVTGWMLMALRSGELAGLEVPSRTYASVRRFLESCREPTGHQARFRYNPQAPADDPRTSHGRNPGTVMTSVGLLMQLYLGEGRESERMLRGADHLLSNLPTVGESLQPARTSTLGNPLRDTYYWYYGTQVMFHVGGQHWHAWNDALHPLLVETQTTRGALAGSWNPLRPVPDKWRHLGGRLYVTTMNLLSLEVYYRHLPLYEMTGR